MEHVPLNKDADSYFYKRQISNVCKRPHNSISCNRIFLRKIVCVFFFRFVFYTIVMNTVTLCFKYVKFIFV